MAAGTVVAILAVLAVPPAMSCFERGLAACLGQAEVVPAADPAPVAAPVAEPLGSAEAVTPTPAGAAIPPGAPAITLLRAEPQGNVVIAGSGNPDARVSVYINGDSVGTTQAEPSGDWVLVPEAPLPAGGVEITVGEAGAAPRTDHSFVVVIDPERVAEPLVVATTPGEASRVLQGLPGVLDALPAPTPEPAVTTVPELPAGPASPASATEPEAALEAPLPATAMAATPPAEAMATPARKAAAASQAVAALAPKAPDLAIADDSTSLMVPGPALAPALAPEPAAAVIGPASIDAIEIDGDVNFFAGAGIEGATMRLYVDGSFVADTQVAGGRWLVEAASVLGRPAQRIRVDMLQPESSDVAARAEVNFVLDAVAAEPDEPALVPAQPMTEAAPMEAAAAEASLPTMTAAVLGDPEDRRFATGKAIIRRGDNLWSIARRVYGKGIRYTTIYRANRDQIRNPRWIYPGQVFDLPGSRD